MFVRRFVMLFLCLLLSLAAAAEAAKAKMPPGSFLTKPVGSASELADLIKQDKIAASRYSKHFGMDAPALAQYFRENLRASKLDKPGRYTVYFIAKNGEIVAHKKNLKAGIETFIAWNGQLILEGKCGNPVTKTLPKPPEKIAVAPLIEPSPSPAVVEPAPVVAEAPVAPEPTVEVLAEQPVEVPKVKGIQQLLIPGLLAAGAIGFAGGSQSESTPIPEPTGLLVLGTGGISLLAYCCKRRR